MRGLLILFGSLGGNPRIENATAECGLKALHPHLVSEARQLAACYSEELMNPLTAFLVKTGSGESNWSDVDTDF